jgi:prepilin-type N-terminal cleavage/methylation domain-containing protein
MDPAPRGAASARAAFTLLEVLVVITIVAILAGIVIAVGRRAAEAGKTARARAELAVLSAALENYKRTYGEYPRTDDGARLVQALIGRKGPTDRDIAGRSLLEVARFTFANSADPFINPAAVLVDPWGQPYVYACQTMASWSNSGYVLYSAGPDGRDFSRLLAGGFPDASNPANVDNIHANR